MKSLFLRAKITGTLAFLPLFFTSLVLTSLLVVPAAHASTDAKITAKLVPALQHSYKAGKPIPPACNSSADNSQLQGNLNSEYFVYIFLEGLDPELPPKGIFLTLKYGPGLEVESWESFSDSQLLFPAPQSDLQWPSTGASVLLTFDSDLNYLTIPEGQVDRTGAIALGALVVIASKPTSLEVSPRENNRNSLTNSLESSISLLDNRGGRVILTYPDNVFCVTFGDGFSPYDPCSGQTRADQAEVFLSPAKELSVAPAGPNPFSTEARWTLKTNKPRRISVSIFSVTGALVHQWPPIAFNAGATPVIWDGTDESGRRVSQGLYYLIAQSEDGFTAIIKTVFLATPTRM